MPNWCSNDLSIYGPQRGAIADFISGGEEEGVIDFNKIIPMPELVKGSTSWYEWCCDSWGTKWNSAGGVRNDLRTRICLTFDTAWCPPVPVVDGLSKMYPKTKFSLRYYEAGNGFKGHYAMMGGKVVADQYTQGYRGRRGG